MLGVFRPECRAEIRFHHPHAPEEHGGSQKGIRSLVEHRIFGFVIVTLRECVSGCGVFPRHPDTGCLCEHLP